MMMHLSISAHIAHVDANISFQNNVYTASQTKLEWQITDNNISLFDSSIMLVEFVYSV